MQIQLGRRYPDGIKISFHRHEELHIFGRKRRASLSCPIFAGGEKFNLEKHQSAPNGISRDCVTKDNA